MVSCTLNVHLMYIEMCHTMYNSYTLWQHVRNNTCTIKLHQGYKIEKTKCTLSRTCDVHDFIGSCAFDVQYNVHSMFITYINNNYM